jgi:hypothetical protein
MRRNQGEGASMPDTSDLGPARLETVAHPA